MTKKILLKSSQFLIPGILFSASATSLLANDTSTMLEFVGPAGKAYSFYTSQKEDQLEQERFEAIIRTVEQQAQRVIDRIDFHALRVHEVDYRTIKDRFALLPGDLAGVSSEEAEEIMRNLRDKILHGINESNPDSGGQCTSMILSV